MRLWDIDAQRCVNWRDTRSQVTGVLWSTRSNELVSAHEDSPLVRVWDLRHTKHVVARLPGHNSPVVALAGDVTQLASSDGKGGLQLRRLRLDSSL